MHITEGQIIGIAPNVDVYKNGVSIYEKGMVHILPSDGESITGVVNETQDQPGHNIAVNLSAPVISCRCSCSFFNNTNNCCKHIIAALKQYQKLYARLSDCDISEMLSAYKKSAPKRKLHLAISIRVHEKALETPYALQIKIGESKMYPVSDIGMLVSALEENKPLCVNPEFTFAPLSDYFVDQHQEFLEIIAEQYYSTIGTGKYVRACQELTFNRYTLMRIFRALSGSSLSHLSLFGENYEDVSIVNANPPLNYEISYQNNVILLQADNCPFVFVTEMGQVVFFDYTIYLTDKNFQYTVAPIYNALKNIRNKELFFCEDNCRVFITKILPALRELPGVQIDGAIENCYVNFEPEFNVYFDTYGKGVNATIKVCYGEYVFDIHRTVSNVLRNNEYEKEFLSLFSSFSREGSMFFLENQDLLFDFITRDLDIISKRATVFCSEHFQRLRQCKGCRFSGSVRISKNGLLEVGFDFSNEETADADEILRELVNGKRYIRLKNGMFLNLLSEENVRLAKSLGKLGIQATDIVDNSLVLEANRALYMDKLLSGRFKRDTEFLQYTAAFDNPSEPLELPKHLDKVLRPYQKRGVMWLNFLYKKGVGGLLADDMGLGKTLQVIALVCGVKPDKPTLVVAPTSLIYNWESEIKHFAPKRRVLVVSGDSQSRRALLKDIKGYAFVITSYHLLCRDSAHYQSLEFSFCIIDEAQHIKNHNSQTSKAVKKIRSQCRFALTGTPIENSLVELWSIFDFLMPGYLLSYNNFLHIYEKGIVREQQPELLADLNARIAPFLLRRMKSEVLSELPEKIESIYFTELLAVQKVLYLSFLERARKQVYEALDSSDNRPDTITILALLTRLRQICCHPALVYDNYNRPSAKLNQLSELVDEFLASGRRILIFSQFAKMLDIIETMLKKKQIQPFYLRGSTSPVDRARMVNEFNAGVGQVFLISLKAGGTGLNLTGADTVIHFDPWWNPAVMDQASDRAYRMGQTRAVQVIKMVAKGTIEEKIITLQEKKQALAESVIGNTDAFMTRISKEEIKMLFSPD